MTSAEQWTLRTCPVQRNVRYINWELSQSCRIRIRSVCNGVSVWESLCSSGSAIRALTQIDSKPGKMSGLECMKKQHLCAYTHTHTHTVGHTYSLLSLLYTCKVSLNIHAWKFMFFIPGMSYKWISNGACGLPQLRAWLENCVANFLWDPCSPSYIFGAVWVCE